MSTLLLISLAGATTYDQAGLTSGRHHPSTSAALRLVNAQRDEVASAISGGGGPLRGFVTIDGLRLSSDGLQVGPGSYNAGEDTFEQRPPGQINWQSYKVTLRVRDGSQLALGGFDYGFEPTDSTWAEGLWRRTSQDQPTVTAIVPMIADWELCGPQTCVNGTYELQPTQVRMANQWILPETIPEGYGGFYNFIGQRLNWEGCYVNYTSDRVWSGVLDGVQLTAEVGALTVFSVVPEPSGWRLALLAWGWSSAGMGGRGRRCGDGLR